MCTLTLIALKKGYRLGMNRDEQRSREAAQPPEAFQQRDGEISVANPFETGGGTWIAINAHGVTLALLNWYSAPQRALAAPVSRGGVIPQLRHLAGADAVAAAIREMNFSRHRPFRLVGIFPDRRAMQWRWNGIALETIEHEWRTQQWISSGFEEAEAQRIRGATFEHCLRQADAETPQWLERLHASHAPERGPFSICMHRADASTVSFTTVECATALTRLDYLPGPSCRAGEQHTVALQRSK